MTIGVERFEDAEYENLSSAPRLVTELGQALEALDYTTVTRAETVLSSAGLGAELHGQFEAANAECLLIVHVLTHGEPADGNASVYLLGSDAERHDQAEVASWLTSVQNRADRRPVTLFLLDLCQAGIAARLSWQAKARQPVRGWVIAAAPEDRPAYDGRFTRAVTNVLRALAARELGIDRSVEHVPVDTIAKAIRREVNRLAEEEDAYPQQVTASLIDMSDGVPLLPFFPNPAYRDDEQTRKRAELDTALQPFFDTLDEGLDARHFVERAAGTETLPEYTAELHGCFTGRDAEVKNLSNWLGPGDTSPLRVVTGSPGAGKSALIGLLVCARHPRLQAETRELWQQVLTPSPALPHLVAVHARRRDAGAVTASLARQLGLDSDTELSSGDFIARVMELRAQPVVVVDALDEADDGVAIMNDLLLPMISARRNTGGPAARLLIGVRGPRNYQEYSPLFAAARDLGGHIDLDAVPARTLEDDLLHYAIKLLRANDRWRPGHSQMGAFAGKLAETLCSVQPGHREWGEFLVTGLYTRYLMARYPDPPATSEEAEEIGARVPRTLPAVLELDLQAQDDVPLFQDVIRVLGHARGLGMPLTVLTRLVPELDESAEAKGHLFGYVPLPGRPATKPEAVQQALQLGRFYLRQSTDIDGTTLYRLFHQGLADHLRQTPWPGLGARLLAALGPPDRRNWLAAEPYVLRHALDHARADGNPGLVLHDPRYFLQPDPATLLPLLPDELRDVYCASVTASPGSPAVSRPLLALNAARAGHRELARRIAELPGEAALSWQPQWTAGPAAAKPQIAAAAPQGPAFIAARGTYDKRIMAWNLASAEATGEPIRCSTSAWAAGRAGDSLLAAICGDDGSIRLWDLLTGQPAGRLPPGGEAPLTAVAIGGDERQAAVVAGGHDGSVFRWDLKAPPPQAAVLLTRHSAPIRAVTAGTLAGQAVAVTCSADGEVRIHDLKTRKQLDSASVPGGSVHALAAGELNGHSVAVFVRRNSAALVRDLKRRTFTELPTGDGYAASAVAVGEAGGRLVAVIGGEDGTVRLWDLAARTPLGDPLPVYDGSVASVALGTVSGRPVAVTGGWNGMMRVLDLTAQPPEQIFCEQVGSRLDGVSLSPVLWSGGRLGHEEPADDEAGDWPGLIVEARRRLGARGGRPVRALAVAELPSGRAVLLGRDGGVVSALGVDTGEPALNVSRVSRSVRRGKSTASSHGRDEDPPPSGAEAGQISAISPDWIAGRPVARVAVGGRRTPLVLDLVTGTWVKTGAVGRRLALAKPQEPSAFILAEDVLVRVEGDDGGAVTVQDNTGRKSLSGGKHDGEVTVVTCQRVGQALLAFSGGKDGTVRVWDITDRRLLDTVTVGDPVFAIEATADGYLLVGAGGEAIVFRHAGCVRE